MGKQSRKKRLITENSENKTEKNEQKEKDESLILQASNKTADFFEKFTIRNQIKRRYDKVRIKDREEKNIPYERYAFLGERVHAQLIDFIILMIFIYSISLLFSGMFSPPDEIMRLQQDWRNGVIGQNEFFSRYKEYMFRKDVWMLLLLKLILQIFFLGLIFVALWSKFSATPGKMLLGLKIVDSKTYEKPQKIQFILRFVGCLISALALFIGFYAANFDKKKQGWHDKIAGTVVVSKQPINADKALKSRLIATMLMIIFLVVMWNLLTK